jgi:lysophospholipase L1-like esterase
VQELGSPGFFREWGSQADLAMATIGEQTDARVVLVLPPPMATPSAQAVVDGLRAEYERLAERWDFIELADATEALGDRQGGWAANRATGGGRRAPVRTPDTVHLAPLGQRLLAREIAGVVDP